MAQETASPTQKAIRGYLQTGGKTIALILAGRAVRLGLILVALIAISWLLYTNVFLVVTESVLLPPGVTDKNPELDHNSLETINNSRVSRSQYQPNSFVPFDSLFPIAFIATPTPKP